MKRYLALLLLLIPQLVFAEITVQNAGNLVVLTQSDDYEEIKWVFPTDGSWYVAKSGELIGTLPTTMTVINCAYTTKEDKALIVEPYILNKDSVVTPEPEPTPEPPKPVSTYKSELEKLSSVQIAGLKRVVSATAQVQDRFQTVSAFTTYFRQLTNAYVVSSSNSDNTILTEVLTNIQKLLVKSTLTETINEFNKLKEVVNEF